MYTCWSSLGRDKLSAFPLVSRRISQFSLRTANQFVRQHLIPLPSSDNISPLGSSSSSSSVGQLLLRSFSWVFFSSLFFLRSLLPLPITTYKYNIISTLSHILLPVFSQKESMPLPISHHCLPARLTSHIVKVFLALKVIGHEASNYGQYPVVVSTWPFVEAIRASWRAMDNGFSIMDSVVEGFLTCEELKCDVGLSGSSDENGETTFNALVMDGISSIQATHVINKKQPSAVSCSLLSPLLVSEWTVLRVKGKEFKVPPVQIAQNPVLIRNLNKGRTQCTRLPLYAGFERGLGI
nr:uncharacterized protein LOC114826649 [Malus domestica]